MKKLLIIIIIIIATYVLFLLCKNIYYIVKEPGNELQKISQNEVSKEAVHAIDDLLIKRISVVVSKKQEDELLSKQYNEDYEDEISRSEAIISYFQRRQVIIKEIKNEIDGGCKELDVLFLKYKEGKPGYQLINAFRNYFHDYKRFTDAAYEDIGDKVRAGIIYKTIVLLETNQQSFYDALEQGEIQQAKKLLDREDELIEIYKQNIERIRYKARIPDEWQKEFIDTYIRMHEWNKKFYKVKVENNEFLYEKILIESAKVMLTIPLIEAIKFPNEFHKIINYVPKEIEKLQGATEESGTKAYALYYEEKQKIGEDPEDILSKF